MTAPTLADMGRARIRYVASMMPVMARTRAQFLNDKPFAGLRIAFCSHLEAKTAHVAKVIRDGGARVMVCGANPASTCDDVAEALREEPGIEVRARHDASADEQAAFVHAAIEWGPDYIADDGADLIVAYHADPSVSVRPLLGACEQTTTGVERVRHLARLITPVVGVNECRSKFLIDNRYGTGESVWAAVAATTNATLRGCIVAIVGYGNCGRGIAAQARGMGARVRIAEIDPIKAMEAAMEGFDVGRLDAIVRDASFVVTATGGVGVVGTDVLVNLKDGVFLCNAGHLDGEIDATALAALAVRVDKGIARHIDEYTLADGRRLKLIARGSIINLAAGNGHSAEIIDITFALQVAALVHLASRVPMEPVLQALPRHLDADVARELLAARGISINDRTA